MGTNISNALSGLRSTSLKQVISCLIGIQIIIACLYIWNNLAGKKKPETKGTPVNKYNAGLSNESGGNGANISSSKPPVSPLGPPVSPLGPPVSPLGPSVSPSAPPLNKSGDLLSQTESILSSSGIGESSINSDKLLDDVEKLMKK
jgi:hypothetical protein